MPECSIAPTILTGNPTEFQHFLTLYPTFAKRIQIDIADGTFVDTTTILPKQISSLPSQIAVDLHLMVAKPSEFLADIIRLRPALCILHAESAEDLSATIAALKKANIKVGIALLQHTYPGTAKSYIESADHVLIFAGALGKQGGTADLLQQEKVKLIRAIKPEVEIGWDGGVNLKNVRSLGHADINVINVGSFIAMNQDPAAAFKQLNEEIEKKGVLL